jgi:hypothetical protein
VNMCCGAGGPAAEERGRRDRKGIGKRRMLIVYYVVQRPLQCRTGDSFEGESKSADHQGNRSETCGVKSRATIPRRDVKSRASADKIRTRMTQRA